MSYAVDTLTDAGYVTLTKGRAENNVLVCISGTYGTASFKIQATADGTNWDDIFVIDQKTGLLVTGGTALTPADDAEYSWAVPNGTNYVGIRANLTSLGSGGAKFSLYGIASPGTNLAYVNVVAAAGSFTNITGSGTLAMTGAATFASTVGITGDVAINTNKLTITAASGNLASAGSILSSSASGGVGYATGAGGTVAQGTSRTTGVTINKTTGTITLFSAAGSATPASFTVTNSAVAATDTVVISQKSGTDAYSAVVSAVAAGSFKVTITDLTGTTTEAPAFNFTVIKGVAA